MICLVPFLVQPSNPFPNPTHPPRFENILWLTQVPFVRPFQAWQTQRNNDDHHIPRRAPVGDFEALNKRYVGYLLQEVQANKDVAAATRET